MTNTITTTAFDPSYAVLWWLLVPLAVGLLVSIIGGIIKSEDTMLAGVISMVFLTFTVFALIFPIPDHQRGVRDIANQLNYSDVEYGSNMQFTAVDKEGYYLKCAIFDMDEKNTYEVVCYK